MRWTASTFDPFKWHTWFAWCPVIVNGQSVWLERIERKHVAGWNVPCGDWEYRLPSTGPT